MSEVEKLAQQRARNLSLFTATYAVWYGAFILRDGGWLGRSAQPILYLIFGVFFLLWMLSAVWLALWQRRARRNQKAMLALNDEMTVRNRWRAQRASAFTLLICLIFGLVIANYADVSGRIAMEILTWVLVISQIGFYLWFDRSE
ncbi:MAG TPA: hypothetical protein VGM47_03650 [Gammaproteobacteria bacterium]|jgi:cbb3-type cytochrome oxidase subunit 3